MPPFRKTIATATELSATYELYTGAGKPPLLWSPAGKRVTDHLPSEEQWKLAMPDAALNALLLTASYARYEIRGRMSAATSGGYNRGRNWYGVGQYNWAYAGSLIGAPRAWTPKEIAPLSPTAAAAATSLSQDLYTLTEELQASPHVSFRRLERYVAELLRYLADPERLLNELIRRAIKAEKDVNFQRVTVFNDTWYPEDWSDLEKATAGYVVKPGPMPVNGYEVRLPDGSLPSFALGKTFCEHWEAVNSYFWKQELGPHIWLSSLITRACPHPQHPLPSLAYVRATLQLQTQTAARAHGYDV